VTASASTTTGAPQGDAGDAGTLRALAERIVALAAPGEQIEVFVARGASTSVKAYGGEVESLTSAESAGVGIRVITDHRQGFAHAGTLDEDVIREVLDDARDNATFGEPDEFFALTATDDVPAVEHDLWSDELVSFPTERKVDMALALERAVMGRDPRVTGVRTASFGDSRGEAAIASTAGISAQWRGTYCSASVSALAVDGDETKIGGAVDISRDPHDLDLERVASDAVDRATRLFGAKPVPSQRLPIVFEPRLASTIISLAGSTLTGERMLKGRSPFADRLGEAIAADCFVLIDDPTNPRSMGADSYDGEGLACRRNVLVDGGVLTRFLHNSYTGRRAKLASTGSAVRGYRSTPGVGCQALSIAPGSRGLDEILGSIDNGFFIQNMTGLHSGVNTVSGDFSVGAEGLMIRNGALAEPVREVTIASTLQRLLLDIAEVGSDLEWLPGGTGAATIVINDVSLSGT
jgi:PmbA protein